MGHLLIVEDDNDLSKITKINLMHAGYTSDTAYTGAEAEQLIDENSYDLILMDMMLPDTTGDSLCASIRKLQYHCPVIFMSCLDDSYNIVHALSCGGDDYVVKPVNFEVLLARIDANIRRYKEQSAKSSKRNSTLRKFKSLSIDTLRRRVVQDDKEVCLSTIEYSLLLFLSEHPDTLLLYSELYNHVWGSDSYGDFRTVMVHISNLRKKIDSAHSGIIETVRGAGYIFCDV